MIGASLVEQTIFVEVKSLTKLDPSNEELELLKADQAVDDFDLVKGIIYFFNQLFYTFRYIHKNPRFNVTGSRKFCE